MSQATIKGVRLNEITTFLEKFAPKSLAESWDNTGLLVEPTAPKFVKNILLTNDLTEDVISEALNINTDLIISYHPPLFKPFKKITMDSWKERIIAACLENKIAIYSPHTRWDSVAGGVNDWLASAFDVEYVQPIKPIESELKNYGVGRYCKLKTGIKISKAVENVKKLICISHLNLALAKGSTMGKFRASPDTIVNDVAICAGSGASVLNEVKSSLYLTGEMSHHALLDAIHSGTNVILCNHSNSERGFLKEFMGKLIAEFGSNVKIFISNNDKDPMIVV